MLTPDALAEIADLIHSWRAASLAFENTSGGKRFLIHGVNREAERKIWLWFGNRPDVRAIRFDGDIYFRYGRKVHRIEENTIEDANPPSGSLET